jgi:hypothetical protein
VKHSLRRCCAPIANLPKNASLQASIILTLGDCYRDQEEGNLWTFSSQRSHCPRERDNAFLRALCVNWLSLPHPQQPMVSPRCRKGTRSAQWVGGWWQLSHRFAPFASSRSSREKIISGARRCCVVSREGREEAKGRREGISLGVMSRITVITAISHTQRCLCGTGDRSSGKCQ